MYGIVNKAIQDMISSGYGEETWDAVKKSSGVDEDFFISNEPYDDIVTYKLAGAASEVLDIPVGIVLNSFGRHWIMKTGKEKYGSLMEAGGSNLKEFLVNLPSFHNRIMLAFPNLNPPEFKVSEIENNSIRVHYFSHRSGLQEFVNGLLLGLGELYNVPTEVVHTQSKEAGYDHDIFKVSW
jgi:hypothetical protein